MTNTTSPKFVLGQLLATPGALEALEASSQQPLEFLARHVSGEWGDLCEEDRQSNDDSLIDGSRILSVYHTSKGVKLWVITEATDESGLRSATTILLPEEY